MAVTGRRALQGFLEDESYAHVAATIAAANDQAAALMAARSPLPRLVRADQGTSQARFLLARLNPSKTQANSEGAEVGTLVYTDDVPFDAFYDQLRRLTVE